ncbi:MAG: hypothetical protein ACLUES_07730 [Flavonifractor plautii]
MASSARCPAALACRANRQAACSSASPTSTWGSRARAAASCPASRSSRRAHWARKAAGVSSKAKRRRTTSFRASGSRSPVTAT